MKKITVLFALLAIVSLNLGALNNKKTPAKLQRSLLLFTK